MSEKTPADQNDEEKPASRRFSAFLSYSHSADQDLASTLKRRLERFATPWYRKTPTRIFRDQATLALTPDLWGSIKDSLLASEYLILLASPAAARSKWVKRELDTWFSEESDPAVPESAPVRRLLLVQTGGEIRWDRPSSRLAWPETTSLPQTLDHDWTDEPRDLGEEITVEPMILELGWAREAKPRRRRRGDFDDAVATIAAKLRGSEKDVLYGEELRQRRLTKRLLASAAAAFTLLLALVFFLTFFAREQTTAATLAEANRLASKAARLEGERRHLGAIALLTKARELSETPEVVSTTLAIGRPIARFDRDQKLPTDELRGALAVSGETLLARDSAGTLWLLDREHEAAHHLGETSAFGAALALDLTGRTLAIGESEGVVRLIDSETGSLLKSHKLSSPPRFLLAHRDSFLVGDENGKIHRLNEASFETLPVAPAGLIAEDGSLDRAGKKLAVSWLGGLVTFHETETWQEIRRFDLNELLPSDETIYHAGTHVSPGGEHLLLAPELLSPILLDLTTPAPSQALPLKIPGQVDPPNATLKFSPGGELILGYEGRTLYAWSASTGELAYTIPSTIEIEEVALDPQGRHLAFSHRASLVGLYDLDTGELREAIDASSDEVRALGFLAEGDILTAATAEGRWRSWHITDEPLRFLGGEGLVGFAAFVPETPLLAYTSTLGLFRVILLSDTDHPQKASHIETVPETPISELKATEDGLLVAATPRGEFGIWDLTEEPPETRVDWRPTEKRPVSALALSTDARRVVFRSEGELFVHSTENGSYLETLPQDGSLAAHWAAATAPGEAISPEKIPEEIRDLQDLEFLAYHDGAMHLVTSTQSIEWTLRSGKVRTHVLDDEIQATALTASSDGRYLAYAIEGRHLGLLDFETGRQFRIENPHQKSYDREQTDYLLELGFLETGGLRSVSKWGLLQDWGTLVPASEAESRKLTGLKVVDSEAVPVEEAARDR